MNEYNLGRAYHKFADYAILDQPSIRVAAIRTAEGGKSQYFHPYYYMTTSRAQIRMWFKNNNPNGIYNMIIDGLFRHMLLTPIIDYGFKFNGIRLDDTCDDPRGQTLLMLEPVDTHGFEHNQEHSIGHWRLIAGHWKPHYSEQPGHHVGLLSKFIDSVGNETSYYPKQNGSAS